MPAKVDREKCMHCGGCVSVCPAMALELREEVLHVYAEKCVSCGNCERVCPVGAIRVAK